MTLLEKLKPYLIALLVALIGVATVLINHLSGTSTQPPISSDPNTSGLVLKGSRGETLGALIPLSETACTPLVHNSNEFQVDYFTVGQITTTKASFKGARIGLWDDPLYPVTELCAGERLWVDIHIPKNLAPNDYSFTINGYPITVRVWKMTMPDAFSMPVYSEITTYKAFLAHYGDPPQNSSDWSKEWEIGEKYIQSAIAHGFYPYRHTPTLSLTGQDWTRYKQYSPGKLFVPIRGPQAGGTNWNSTAFNIAESEIWGDDKIVYLYDEPKTTGGVSDQEILTSLNQLKTSAPSVKSLITMDYDSNVPLDLPAPVFEHLASQNQGPQKCGYVSCMSTGCSENGNLSGAPGMEVELPPVYRRAFLWIAYQSNLYCLIYYHMMIEFRNVANGSNYSIWHSEGGVGFGNGDGTLFGPPDINNQLPVVTLRMKQIRQAVFDYEYLKWANADVASLIRSPIDWEKDETKYDAFREQLGEKLNNE